MGIIPLQFLPNENADSLQLTGKEQFTIDIPQNLVPHQEIKVTVSVFIFIFINFIFFIFIFKLLF